MTKPVPGKMARKLANYPSTRAVEWLKKQPVDCVATALEIAEAIGYTNSMSTLQAGLRKLAASGVLRYTRGPSVNGHGGWTVYWSLMPAVEREGGSEACAEVQDEADVLPRRTSAPEIKSRAGMLFPGVYASAGSAP